MRRALILTAAVLMAGSAIAAGLLHEGYDHARHPLSLPGASGMPGWWLVNAGLFVLPGLLVGASAWMARQAGSGWALRLALQMLQFSALAFALQGVFNLDPARLPDDGGNRWHALAWMGWWLCFALSTVFMALARGLSPAIRLAAAAVALGVPVAVMSAPALGMAAIVQRLVVVAWFALAMALAGRRRDQPRSATR